MKDDLLKYFRIAKTLNVKHEEALLQRKWHFRGNCNSYSLISLNSDTPELGLSRMKAVNPDFENTLIKKMNVELISGPGRKTPEKVLQAWIINSALNNKGILPFGENLTLITSELAIMNDDKGFSEKKKIVNDILAIDDAGTLWVVELKSARAQTELKKQVDLFMRLIDKKKCFFTGLVKLLHEENYNRVGGMIVWPYAKAPRDDWGDIVEVRYKPHFKFY